MSESYSRSLLDLWKVKLLLTVLVVVLWLLNWYAVDEEWVQSISGASEAEVNYLGAKAASFAVIAAVALSVYLIPARSLLLNIATGAAGAAVAMFSGYYWLEEATDGNAGNYILVVGLAGLIMVGSVAIGPIVGTMNERKSGRK